MNLTIVRIIVCYQRVTRVHNARGKIRRRAQMSVLCSQLKNNMKKKCLLIYYAPCFSISKHMNMVSIGNTDVSVKYLSTVISTLLQKGQIYI